MGLKCKDMDLIPNVSIKFKLEQEKKRFFTEND